jgi:hypothetical protein
MRAYLMAYRWRRVEPVPCARLRAPVSSAAVALVTTAGLVPPGTPLFDESVKGGDVSFRWVEAEADGTVTRLLSQIEVDPALDPDTAVLAMLLAA